MFGTSAGFQADSIRAPRFRVGFNHRSIKIGKLVNLGPSGVCQCAPLFAIDRAKITIFIGPFIPDRHAVFLQITDIGVATDEPQQFMDRLSVI